MTAVGIKRVLGTLDHTEKLFQSIAGLAKLWTNLVVSMDCIQTFDTQMDVGRKYMPHISLVSCFTDAIVPPKVHITGFSTLHKRNKAILIVSIYVYLKHKSI